MRTLSFWGGRGRTCSASLSLIPPPPTPNPLPQVGEERDPATELLLEALGVDMLPTVQVGGFEG